MPEDGEGLARGAVQALYRIWWEEAETSSEEQCLEIHRLALAGGEGEIAVEIAFDLTAGWNNRSRFREVIILCEETLKTFGDDYRLLHNLARGEEILGDVEKALKNFQQASEVCPDEDAKVKSAILHNMARIYASQGQIKESLSLYKASLEIKESIGDVQGKAATLHQMAGIYAVQGRIEEALSLYKESADIEESIGNVQGKAATLHQMAGIYEDQGQIEEALHLQAEKDFRTLPT
ncbi:MAG: hypothetical protein DRI57_02655 [Deltaproteobacteria bacterium]|nr:MAG: hypothetical protein DRI57_02655 [Deltaproteobacteria bacterium]